ncbi:MAG TPA: OPT/YSL family transporter [Haliangiales bacterium]|nr:OPT/YSL family transporter [Haliangiales bacterium]
MRPRAVLVAAIVGAVLVSANVYLALTVGFTETGNLLTATMAVALARLARRPLAPEETFLAQAFASCAGMCTAASGLSSVVPALAAAGQAPSGWAIVPFGAAVGTLGVLAGAFLGPTLLEREKLVFPTGRATAETIVALHGRTPGARAIMLALGAGVAGAVTLLRDALGWIPGMLAAPFVPAGLRVGIGVSPALLGIGALVGPATCVALVAAGCVTWLGVAPFLGLGDDYTTLIGWIVWPAVALMMSEPAWMAIAAVANIGRGGRSLYDVRASLRDAGPPRAALLVALAAAAVTVVAARAAFGLHPLVALAVLVIAILPAAAAARAAGRTDVIPGESGGQIAQSIVGLAVRGGIGASMSAGILVMGSSTYAGVALMNLRARALLGFPLRRSIAVMAAGAAFGALCGFCAYTLIARHAVPGSPSLPAPSMRAWRAVAVSVAGTAALPAGAPVAALAAFGAGLLACALRTRWPRVPAPVALGIGAILPLSATATLLLGGAAAGVAGRLRPAWCDAHLVKLAAGAIMGESLVAVAVGLAS